MGGPRRRARRRLEKNNRSNVLRVADLLYNSGLTVFVSPGGTVLSHKQNSTGPSFFLSDMILTTGGPQQVGNDLFP